MIGLHLRKLVYGVMLWTCFGYLVFRVAYPELVYPGVSPRRSLLQDPGDLGLAGGPAAVLQTDPSPPLSDAELLTSLSNRFNLPRAYWGRPHQSSGHSDSCAQYPSLFDLQFNNLYWQVLATPNGTFYLYGAYFDGRRSPRQVRLVGMVDRLKPPPVSCLLWFSQLDAPLSTPALFTYSWYHKWGNYEDGILQPYVISCLLPKRMAGMVPASVSLVQRKCDPPTNNLRVVDNRPAPGTARQDFAVCVKGLDFLQQDLSLRLVEWLELLRLLGARKVFLYELEVHPNISKVLSYYQRTGFVDVTPISLPGHQPNLPGFRHLYLKSKLTHKRQNEIIPYNDCLYRNLNMYRHLVLLDTDEVIVPVRHADWADMFRDIATWTRGVTKPSYNVRNVYFLDDARDGEEMRHEAHEQGIPPHMHILQHVYRAANFTAPGSFVKCFHSTDLVVSLHNHFPTECLGPCLTYSVDTGVAQLQHYRKDCEGTVGAESCKDFRRHTVRDTTVWRYKDRLVDSTTAVLKELDFLS